MTNPTYPITNLGYLDIQGGRLTYATSTTFTVASGQFRDSTNINDIVLSSAVTVTVPSTSAVTTTGLNGLDTGTLGTAGTATNTIYYVYVVASSTNGSTTSAASAGGLATSYTMTDPASGETSTISIGNSYLPAGAMISKSSTGPLLPAGYDMYRRIGFVRINGSSATPSVITIEPFIQTGYGKNRTMRYQTPVAVGAGGPGATGSSQTYVTIGALLGIVPQLVSVDVLVNCALSAGTPGNCLLLTAANGTSSAPAITLSYSKMSSLVGAAAGLFQVAQLVCPCALNNAATPVMEIDYCTQAYGGAATSNDNVAFTIAGYIDIL